MKWLMILFVLLLSIEDVQSVSISGGLDGLADWSRSHVYVNLVRQARSWGSAQSPYDNNATFDPQTGWPTEDFGMVIATDNLDLGGKYLLSAKGNAQVSLSACSGYFTNERYDPTTNTMTAIINIREGEDQIFVSFRNTTGPGLTDVVLLQPGYDLSSKSNISKLMLAHLSRFSLIRFMDWTGTNNNPEMNWNETTPIDWPHYASRRNPWGTIPLIMNSLDKSTDAWINIPANATDDYITNIAQLMFKQLNERSNIYLEYSNEVWNWQFRQATDNLHAANRSVLEDGDPHHFNYDNCSNVGYWAWRRTAYQIKHISDLFKTVFGNENVGQWKRVRPILAGQVAYPFVIFNGLEYLNAVFGPPSNYLHGMAGAPYFNLGKYTTWTNLTTDDVLNAFNISIEEMSPEQGWSEKSSVGVHGVYAGWYELAMHGYEGGPDTAGACGECSLEAKINATRDPRMTDICVNYLTKWFQFGFEPLNWFVAGADEIGKYGSWGVLEDMRQETLIDTTTMFNASSPVARLPRPAPKLKALDEVHKMSSIEVTFGIPVPSENNNATNFADHRDPYPDPYLENLHVNATFYYPLKIVQSPIRINVIVYTSGDGGILEGGINNQQFVQIQTPKTSDWKTFQPAPAMQFNINQRVAPSVAGFRLRVVQSGFNIQSFNVVIA